MLLGMSTLTMAQTDPGATNLTHQWTFDDGTANDNIGTVHGALMGSAEVVEGSLKLAGESYVELNGSDLAINTYSEVSFSTWFTTEKGMNDGYRFLFYFGGQNGTNGANMTGFTPTRGDNVSKVIVMTTDGEKGLNGPEFDDNIQHHLVYTVDATSITYYVDGILLGSAPIGATTLADVATSLAYFGKGGWPDPTWAGSINEISIYNKVLTLDNVKYLYDLKKVTIPAEDPGTANLTHQWTFDDGTATDIIGGITTTLQGNTTVTDKALDTSADGFVEFDAAALAINTYSALSVEAWFTSVAGENNGFHFLYYFGNSNGGGQNFTGYTPARGNDRGLVMINSAGENSVPSAEYNDGLLHHMVSVVDETSISLYIDGVLMGTNPTAISLSSLGTDFAWIGKGGWPDPNWKGLLNKFSIYDNALTANNVNFLYNLGAENTGTGIKEAKNEIQTISLNNNQLVAEFQSAAASKAKIEIYNIQGKMLSSNSFAVNAGHNRKTIQANLATGIYVVRLDVNGKTTYSKIVK